EVAGQVTRYLASVQERLQQTRVAQAEAEVKAAEEHKRWRLAVFLAVAVVVLMLGASAFGLWYVNHQARRDQEQGRLNQEVSTALDEAVRLRDDLHARLSDPRRAAQLLSELLQWQVLLDSARASWKRADTLAAGGRDLLPAELQDRLTALAEQLADDERDRQLVFE